jgi:hypothetical protein
VLTSDTLIDVDTLAFDTVVSRRTGVESSEGMSVVRVNVLNSLPWFTATVHKSLIRDIGHISFVAGRTVETEFTHMAAGSESTVSFMIISIVA